MADASWKQGERQVCQILERLWGVKFYRSESSGGLATSRQKTLPKSVVDALTGDVICDSQDPKLTPGIGWPFSVEVKTRHDNIDVFDICRNGKKSEIAGWYDQCCRDAVRSKKLPLMFMKKVGGHGWYVALDTDFFGELMKKLSERRELANASWQTQFIIAEDDNYFSWLRMTVISADNFISFGRPLIENTSKIYLERASFDGRGSVIHQTIR